MLRTTSVSKCLDKKLLILGFEIPDLLALFLTISVLNFLFGSSPLRLFLVWLPSVAIALVFYFGKKGKPEGHLAHWLRFQVAPGVLSAFPDPSVDLEPPRSPREVSHA